MRRTKSLLGFKDRVKVTESGLRVRTRVTVLLSALGGETVTPDHMTQSLQQMRAGRGVGGGGWWAGGEI